MADNKKQPDKLKVIRDETGFLIIERKPERPSRPCDRLYAASTPKET